MFLGMVDVSGLFEWFLGNGVWEWPAKVVSVNGLWPLGIVGLGSGIWELVSGNWSLGMVSGVVVAARFRCVGRDGVVFEGVWEWSP